MPLYLKSSPLFGKVLKSNSSLEELHSRAIVYAKESTMGLKISQDSQSFPVRVTGDDSTSSWGITATGPCRGPPQGNLRVRVEAGYGLAAMAAEVECCGPVSR